jgi:hypothetical protein
VKHLLRLAAVIAVVAMVGALADQIEELEHRIYELEGGQL